jgi:hypothetical protein
MHVAFTHHGMCGTHLGKLPSKSAISTTSNKHTLRPRRRCSLGPSSAARSNGGAARSAPCEMTWPSCVSLWHLAHVICRSFATGSAGSCATVLDRSPALVPCKKQITPRLLQARTSLSTEQQGTALGLHKIGRDTFSRHMSQQRSDNRRSRFTRYPTHALSFNTSHDNIMLQNVHNLCRPDCACYG